MGHHPRGMPLLLRRSAAGIAALLVLGGCASTDAPAAQPEPGEVEEQNDSDPPESMVTPRPGMIDVEPVRIWYEFGSWDGDDSYVVFPSQGPPCEVLDRVEIDEAETHVTITLYQGREPDIDPDEPCDGPTRAVGVVLTLSRDYGPEEGSVINGASLTDAP
jgi:hypothetical protein